MGLLDKLKGKPRLLELTPQVQGYIDSVQTSLQGIYDANVIMHGRQEADQRTINLPPETLRMHSLEELQKVAHYWQYRLAAQQWDLKIYQARDAGDVYEEYVLKKGLEAFRKESGYDY